MGRVRIVATADVHSPRYLPLLTAGLADLPRDTDFIVWAGDMVLRGRLEALRPVLELFRERYPEAPIVAVYGNEEYWSLEEKFREKYSEVHWLNDELLVCSAGGLTIGFVGTRGSLERPTSWQRRNMPELWGVYRRRPGRIEELVREARGKADIVILISHYAVGFKTVEGEPRRIWPEMGSRLMEEAVRRSRPDLVIHGHAHNARRLEATINGVPVYNVSLPARRKPLYIELPLKRGLEAFLA